MDYLLLGFFLLFVYVLVFRLLLAKVLSLKFYFLLHLLVMFFVRSVLLLL
jgi:hypothetical protein